MIKTLAGASAEPAWSLEGRSITVDSCGVDCHCLIGGPPDHGLSGFEEEEPAFWDGVVVLIF
jgi:hypothetical protein